jgi:hypothetical protein
MIPAPAKFVPPAPDPAAAPVQSSVLTELGTNALGLVVPRAATAMRLARMAGGPKGPPKVPSAFGRKAGLVGVEGAAEMGGAVRDHIAYADKATHTWATQSVLSSGDSGLSPEAEATLTKAAASGDTEALQAAVFRLQQQFPKYAKKMEATLKSLNED